MMNETTKRRVSARKYYATPAGKIAQYRANKKLANKRKLAWEWIKENKPEVAKQINNQISKEMQWN
jgi:hypothetical protein